MLSHPGTELQLLIKEKGLTQKAFSAILGKKVSELNELLKGKRNITIQRDYLLHQTLGTPIKYRILKQVDYDYSQLDTNMFPHSSSEELKKSPFDKGDGEPANLGDTFSSHRHSEATAKESFLPGQGEVAKLEGVINTTPHPEQSEDPKSPTSVRGEPRLVGEGGFNSQQLLNQEPKNENDEDFKNRVQIFRNF